MQIIFEFVTQTVLWGTGAAIKKLRGRSSSAAGNSEMWIGLAVWAAAIAILVMLARRDRRGDLLAGPISP